MKYIKLLLATLLLATSLSVGVAGVATAANIQGSLCQGSELETNNGQPGDCNDITANSGTDVNGLVTDIINIFSWIVGVVCVIMIIYGGFRYVTAGGDPGNVTKAKDTILYAIIGLIIVALAQVIVKFILSKVTNTES